MTLDSFLSLENPEKLEKEFLFVRKEINDQLRNVFGLFNGTKTPEQIAYQQKAAKLENLLVMIDSARAYFLESQMALSAALLTSSKTELTPYLLTRKTKRLRKAITSAIPV